MRHNGRVRSILFIAALGALSSAAACGGGSDDGSAPVVALSPPALVQAVPGDAVATVDWSLVEGATGYLVYWCPGTELTVPAASVSAEQFALDYVITGLTPGATYCIVVATVHDGLVSVPSEEVLVTLAPAVPNVVSATATDTTILVDWTLVEGATSYEVYRSTTPDLTPENGDLVATEAPPFEDASVAKGTMYYYLVVSVGAGGRGEPSSVVAAEVEVVVGAPTSLTVTIPEEAPRTLLLTWSPPTGVVPDSYNLYWDTVAGVDATSTQVLGVTSPYTHGGLVGQTTYYYRVTAVLGGFESAMSAEVSGTPRGGKGGSGGSGGGGHEEGFGNNLSMPLILSDGYGILGAPLQGTQPPWLDVASGLRPVATDTVSPFPFFETATAVKLNDIDVYPQKTASTWQAEWRDGSKPVGGVGGETAQDVTVDWGDNLKSASVTTQSVVRVETTLYQEVADDPMESFNMTLLGGSGQTESWGTDGTVAPSTRRHVFAVNARLRIEKLLGPGGAPDPSVPAVDLAVVDGFESTEEGGGAPAAPEGGGGGSGGGGSGGGGGMPVKYGAEINVSGKLVYGYVWSLRTSPVPEASRAGWWRATFVLDSEVKIGTNTVNNNTFIVAVDATDTDATFDSVANTCSIEFQVE